MINKNQKLIKSEVLEIKNNAITDHFVPKTPLLKSWFKSDIGE
jgi:hypothetical protein